jgi:hypothetical protein
MTQPANEPTPRPGNLLQGTLAAIGGALAGAVLWAVVASASNYKVGFVAIGVGAAAGILAGKAGGAHPRLPFVAAAVALLGCVLGDLLIDAHDFSAALAKLNGSHVSSFRVFKEMVLHPSDFGWEVYKAGFAPMDALFYAIAALAGFRLATQHGAQRAPAAPPVLSPEPPATDQPV